MQTSLEKTKRSEYAGLITEEKARSLAQTASPPEFKARVLKVWPARKFEKDGRRGRVCKVLLRGVEGEKTLVLWNKDVGLVKNVKRDSIVVVKNAFEKGGELHSRLLTELETAEDDPSIPKSNVPCGEEFSESKEFDFEGNVVEVQPLREFEKEGGKGFVCSVAVKPGRMVFWGERAPEASSVVPGNLVRVEGLYYKNGEAHAAEGARLMVLGEGEARTASLKDLADGQEALVEAELTALYEAKKVEKEGSGFWVLTGEVAQGDEKKRVAFFGEQVFELLDVNEESVDASTALDLKRGYLLGEKIRFLARAKKNEFSGETELVAKKVFKFVD